MSKFRKKPVEIEARRFDTADYDEALAVVKWCGGRATDRGCEIDTLEGVMLANPGDWIIQGVNGEFYPCKPDIFEATYDAVDEPIAALGKSPGCKSCGQPYSPTHDVNAPGPTVRHPFQSVSWGIGKRDVS